MATTIKLYYTDRNTTYGEWELIPNKLLIVEDIASFLALHRAMTFTNIQYIKNDLEIGVNLDLSQSYSQPKASTSFKYVSIQNTDELIHYYFVKKITWRSKSAVRLELILDVLNTFQEGYDYEFKKNTRIIREHKDRIYRDSFTLLLKSGTSSFIGTIDEEDIVYLRSSLSGSNSFRGVFKGYSGISQKIQFSSPTTLTQIKDWLNNLSNYYIWKDSSNHIQKIGNPSIDGITDNKFFRKIDYVSEGINPVLINKRGLTQIENPTLLLAQNWYLLYRNQDNPTESLVNPVECYLIPENETPVDSGVITSGRITATSLIVGKYYYARIYEENLVGVQLISQSITLPNGTTITGKNSTYGRYIEITRTSGNKLNVILYNYYNNYSVVTYLDIDYIQLNNLPFKYIVLDTRRTATQGFYLSSIWNNELEWTNTEASNKLFPVSQLDKTDAKNIKLIKLPYCPYNFTITGGKIAVNDDTKWDYTYFTQSNNINFYAIKLHDLNTNLTATLNTSAGDVFDELVPLFQLGDRGIYNKRKTNNYFLESKLYHSEFYQPTYFYDSFSFKIDLEKCDMSFYTTPNYNLTRVVIQFDMTRTINSKFLFTFANYKIDKAEQNIPNVMPIARNNEEVLYNVPYINWIRNGYNYEIKAKNLQNASNIVGVGLGAGSLAVSLAMPSAPLKIAGVVASLVSMAMSVKNAIVSAVQSENSLKQKQEQYKNQASSVAGSDDVDLMSVYCGNRIQHCCYEPTDIMANLLGDLFFFAGYSSNRMGIPNHHTRVNFDYLECDASIQAISSIPEECLTELINCFKNGVTYLHKTNRTYSIWDFKQEYENWELELID